MKNAAGNRPYVLVDLYGNANALPKLIDDKSIRTKDIRAFLEKDFPSEALPSVEEAQKLVASHRKLIERSVREDDCAGELAALRHGQRERRRGTEREREALKYRQHALRLAQQAKHRTERDRLRADHLALMRKVRLERQQNSPTGLAAFLGQVSGVSFLRHKLHHYQDARRIRTHLDQQTQLKARQAQEVKTLELRLRLQARSIDRKVASLEKVDKRELAAFMRDQQRDRRIRARGEDSVMPSLLEISGLEQAPHEKAAPDVLAAFEKAKRGQAREVPDLMAAFERAVGASRKEREGKGESEGLDQAKPSVTPHHRKGNEPDRER